MITFPRLRADVNYFVDVSEDLQLWAVVATNPGVVGGQVTLTVPVDPSEERFLRLRVSRI